MAGNKYIGLLAVLLFLAGCGTMESSRSTVVVCGVFGACELENASENEGDIDQEEGAQDVAPELDLTP